MSLLRNVQSCDWCALYSGIGSIAGTCTYGFDDVLPLCLYALGSKHLNSRGHRNAKETTRTR